jgi:hypothetical protein
MCACACACVWGHLNAHWRRTFPGVQHFTQWMWKCKCCSGEKHKPLPCSCARPRSQTTRCVRPPPQTKVTNIVQRLCKCEMSAVSRREGDGLCQRTCEGSNAQHSAATSKDHSSTNESIIAQSAHHWADVESSERMRRCSTMRRVISRCKNP